MKKNQKKLMYLSGALVGLGILSAYFKNKKKQVEKEESFIEQNDLNQQKNNFEERKYIKIK